MNFNECCDLKEKSISNAHTKIPKGKVNFLFEGSNVVIYYRSTYNDVK